MVDLGANTPSGVPPRPVRRHRWRRSLTIIAITLALGTIALAIGCNTAAARHRLARALIWVTNTNRTIDPADDPSPAALRAIGVDRQIRVEVGPPAASLHVWVIDPKPSTTPRARGCLILLHGINSNKRDALEPGRRFAEHGYRAILVDLRAHGSSSGQWTSFGVHESRDLKQLIDALTAQGVIDGPIGMWAPSLGGAVAIQLAAIDDRVKAVVSLDTFASLRAIAPRYVRRYLPGIGWFFREDTIQAALNEAGQIADFDPDDASPLRAIARTRCPVLLVHGSADEHIPPSDAQQLHEAAPDHSEVMIVEGAGHNDVAGPRTFEGGVARSLEWFEDHGAAGR